MIRCMYSVADGPPSRRGPTSTAADFRKLTPLVLRQALEAAGTVVCEPTVRVSLEVPTPTLGAVMPALIRLGGTVDSPSASGDLATLEAILPVGRADELQRQLAGLTGGEGVLESTFAGYQPAARAPNPVTSAGVAKRVRPKLSRREPRKLHSDRPSPPPPLEEKSHIRPERHVRNRPAKRRKQCQTLPVAAGRAARQLSLGTRMGSVVHAAQAATVDVAVELRRREGAVAEELLDGAEVGSAFE
jgi:elongation factor G-like protein